jgi:hypothetical protein
MHVERARPRLTIAREDVRREAEHADHEAGNKDPRHLERVYACLARRLIALVELSGRVRRLTLTRRCQGMMLAISSPIFRPQEVDVGE